MGAIDAIGLEARRVLLEALMAIAWADRTLVEEERKAAQAAALGLGLVMPGDQDLTAPDRKPTPPEELPVDRLNARDRELIYLCASWMVLADEVVAPEETNVLERLKARLEVADDKAVELDARAKELRESQSEGTSWWRSFNTLVVEAAKAIHG